MTWERAQPSATARSASAYCSRVDSVCSSTWPLVDCRTYTIAARARCSGRIFSCGSPSGCMTAFTMTASRRAAAARAASIASSATTAVRRSGGTTAQTTGSGVTTFPALGCIALTRCR